MVYFCYIDESGTPQVPGNTSHYILAGISIPISFWKSCEKQINWLKSKYHIQNQEIHTGWMIRKYIEQINIPNFEKLSYTQRRVEVETIRKSNLLTLQKSRNRALYRQTKKNYRQTEAYIHLTYNERKSLINELGDMIGSWGFARIFAECIDKVHFNPSLSKESVDEQALEQVVSRFELYMKSVHNSTKAEEVYGALVHDNNETVSKNHTNIMKRFHQKGTLWTSIDHIIETPFFVNSELTSLVQVADLCCYAIRRYFENNETDLFMRIHPRIDRKKGGRIVGVRHFSNDTCKCMFCMAATGT